MRFKIQKARHIVHDIIPSIRKKRIHEKLNHLNKEEDVSNPTNGLGGNGNSFFKQNLDQILSKTTLLSDITSPIPPFS